MYRLPLTLIALSLLLGGCATTRIVEYDAEKDEQVSTKDLYVPTDNWVKAAEHKGIVVDVVKTDSVHDEQHNIDLQQWDVSAWNQNNEDKCVGIMWRLLDFQFITNHTTDVLVRGEEMLHLGRMLGKTMVIDGVVVAPPPSGYVQAMRVFNPDWSARRGEECVQIEEDVDDAKIVPEWNIRESKDPVYQEQKPTAEKHNPVKEEKRLYQRQTLEYNQYEPHPEYDQYEPKDLKPIVERNVYYIPPPRRDSREKGITASEQKAMKIIMNIPSMIKVHNP